jgi:tRNA-specific 2-thiouridylase
MLLPVGDLTKSETRARARQLDLHLIADKEESQEICFVPDGDYAGVLRRRLGADAPSLAPGPIELSDGTPVGGHVGFAHFTVGQRRGLPGGFPVPMFVLAIEPGRRAIIIGPREELLGRGVTARELNWLDEPSRVGEHVHVQVRHRAEPASAEVIRLDGDEIELALQQPVAAIAPGQSLVIFRDDRVAGGGFIESSVPARMELPVVGLS